MWWEALLNSTEGQNPSHEAMHEAESRSLRRVSSGWVTYFPAGRKARATQKESDPPPPWLTGCSDDHIWAYRAYSAVIGREHGGATSWRTGPPRPVKVDSRPLSAQRPPSAHIAIVQKTQIPGKTDKTRIVFLTLKICVQSIKSVSQFTSSQARTCQNLIFFSI